MTPFSWYCPGHTSYCWCTEVLVRLVYIMGLKKMFKKKEPTEQELVEDLNRVGISTKNKSGGRPDQFSAFRQYAEDRRGQKPGLAPVNPYANLNQSGLANPYAESATTEETEGLPNRYGQKQSPSPYASSSSSLGQSSNPYGSGSSSNPYSSGTSQRADPYSRAPRASPYAQTRSSAASIRTSRTTDDTESLDLNQIPTNTMPVRTKPIRRPAYDEQTLDLNDVPEDEDLNVDLDDEQQEVNSEDEEVEAIKQDIRFVKQESVNSTRNTLRMAQEADALATNTMGMLGSQSSRLYNAEQNLLLADTQTNIADEKVKQLQRLNRSIFIPATSVNPFNKKARLRQQEAKIKTDKAQEKYLRDTNRQGIYESEQRIKQGITNNATASETHAKYRGEKDLQAAQRYQFEADSEDDEMEKEIASNLDAIGQYSKKLKNSALVMGQEVESQNARLRKIEDDADRLDINVHMNHTRLSNIR